MSNTLGGINLAQIAQKSLDSLKDQLLILNNFTTDFSGDVANVGESVTTRVATQPGIQDFTATTAAADVTTTAKTITLSNYKGVRISFTDLEAVKTPLRIEQLFLNDVTNTIGNALIDSTLALVTNANFSTAAFVGAASTFDADDMADIAGALTAAKVRRNPRFCILSPTYITALCKDGSIKSQSNYGASSAIQDRVIPRVAGMSVYEYTDIPSNSENLVGLAGAPQGLLIATRLPSVPANAPGMVETVVDPETGLAIQVRSWYSLDDRCHYLESGIIYGVAVGVAGNVKRITSA